MENIDAEEVLKFVGLVNNLKHSSRRGWVQSEVQGHENIAGHMYSMAMMTFLLGDGAKVDRLKCLQMALVHDLAEAIVGDITPRDNIPADEKHRMEDEAMKEITAKLGPGVGDHMYRLYKEYEAKETEEAKFVKDLDTFDLLFCATYYEKRDNTPGKLQEYFTHHSQDSKFHNPFIYKLVQKLQQQRDLLKVSNGNEV